MATVQIRDLPEQAYDILRSRARDRGQSLQAYMRDVVIDLAFTPTKFEVLADITASIERDGGLVVDRDELRAGRDDGRR
jgi:plasmid stability protein